MYHVYILNNIKDKSKSYVGMTIKPVTERLREHNMGLNTSTKTFKPWKLIYYENFYCKLCADKREIFLKSGVGNRFKQIILNNYQSLK